MTKTAKMTNDCDGSFWQNEAALTEDGWISGNDFGPMLFEASTHIAWASLDVETILS